MVKPWESWAAGAKTDWARSWTDRQIWLIALECRKRWSFRKNLIPWISICNLYFQTDRTAEISRYYHQDQVLKYQKLTVLFQKRIWTTEIRQDGVCRRTSPSTSTWDFSLFQGHQSTRHPEGIWVRWEAKLLRQMNPTVRYSVEFHLMAGWDRSVYLQKSEKMDFPDKNNLQAHLFLKILFRAPKWRKTYRRNSSE